MAELICLIIDVGASAARPLHAPGGQNGQLNGHNGEQNGHDNEHHGEQPRSFLQAFLECASLFLERKLFMEAKDEVGIVLFGTEETQNELDYENIKLLDRGFTEVDWDVISFIREHVSGTNVESNWFNAVAVALDAMKTASTDKKYEAMKLVLLSDVAGESNTNMDDVDIVIRSMGYLGNVDFTFIGPEQLIRLDLMEEEDNGYSSDPDQDHPAPKHRPSRHALVPGSPRNGQGENETKPLTTVQITNYEIVSQIVADTGGTACSLDDAVATFFYKNKKGKKPFPWKVTLEIGPDIKINTTGYVKTRREAPKSWKRCLATSSSGQESHPIPGTSAQNLQELHPTTQLIRNNEEQESVNIEDTFTSYRYGTDMVPMDEADEGTMKFDAGPKSMTLFGFINRNEIEMSDLMGNGNMIFLPNEQDDNSVAALSTLTEAMLELDTVAIVRRVYRKGLSAHLGVLAPEFDEEGQLYLAYCELPFAEERRELQFPSLNNPRHPLSADQTRAVDDLIDVMDLENQTDGDEGSSMIWFVPEEQLNPQYQYLYQALTQRALSKTSGEELPTVPEQIQNKLFPNENLVKEADSVIQRLRELFPLEQVESKGKRTADKVFGGDEQDERKEPDSKKLKDDGSALLPGQDNDDEEGERIILSVGSINPVQDFEYLLAHTSTTGANIQSAGGQIEEIIERFLASAFGTDLNNKIIQCLKAYRAACRARDRPELYNNFIRLVKSKAGEKLWNEIKDQEADTGMIRNSEVDGGVQDQEADNLFHESDETTSKGNAALEDEEDIEDLL